MNTKTIDFDVVVELFFLLLIGIGPKIALVPFLDVTAGMDAATKGLVIRKMLTTASVVAAILVVFGELLTRLLHFSTGALAVAGGTVLLIIAVSMVLGWGDGSKPQTSITEKEPMRLAVYPLAIPYLLNPVGIVVLVTVSAEAASIARVGLVIGILALVLALDVVVFRWANKVSERLDESRMLVTEKVFGFLLAALAVELVLTGLDSVGVVHLTGR
jgi:small neutral amino acid transporter SnatA (MarC family)